MLGLKKGTVRVVSYRPDWSNLFEQERRLLQRHIGHLALDIQHVGSTAVPGLDAKPTLDIAVAVASASVIPQVVRRLGHAGYVDRGDKGKDGGRLFVKESASEVRTHHVHVVTIDDPQWREYLLFRDALKNDEALRARYAAFKRALRERYPEDRSAYTAAKRTFVRDVLSRQT
jgi:GrpB-like predicted nucleotidyltransferase (UPF0157 family)